MCNYGRQRRSPEEMARRYGALGPTPNAAPVPVLCPTDLALVVRRHPRSGERRLDLLRWDFQPPGPRRGRPVTNAKAETVATNGLFREAFAERRAVVPFDAFFEWRTEAKQKTPFAFTRPDGQPINLAGLWRAWPNPDGGLDRVFVVITTEPNALMAPIHDRMPVVLADADVPVWLGETEGDPAALLRPAPEEALVANEMEGDFLSRARAEAKAIREGS